MTSITAKQIDAKLGPMPAARRDVYSWPFATTDAERSIGRPGPIGNDPKQPVSDLAGASALPLLAPVSDDRLFCKLRSQQAFVDLLADRDELTHEQVLAFAKEVYEDCLEKMPATAAFRCRGLASHDGPAPTERQRHPTVVPGPARVERIAIIEELARTARRCQQVLDPDQEDAPTQAPESLRLVGLGPGRSCHAGDGDQHAGNGRCCCSKHYWLSSAVITPPSP